MTDNFYREGPPSKEFLDIMEEYGVKDWENPLHYYDYMSAVEAGERPDEGGHWLSKYKHPLHPNRYVQEDGQWIDTISGEKATEEDKIINDMKRTEYEGNRAFE
tara:strand:+ start:262 stop:573 length:312 start_codon:yes stop_codon:yes gene_type:complete